MYFPQTGTTAKDEPQFFFDDSNYFPNFDNIPPANTDQQNIDILIDSGLGDYSPQAFSNGSIFVSGQHRDNDNGIVPLSSEENGYEKTSDRSEKAPEVPENRTPSITSTKSGNRMCRVCGDKALGYNFNVITCESCKAFFRRNALKKKDFRCPSRNNCNITVSSRRYCQKCRLRKCFEVGMRPEYIMTEEQRAEKRKRLLSRAIDKVEESSRYSDEGDSRSDQEGEQTKSQFGNGIQENMHNTNGTILSTITTSKISLSDIDNDSVEITIRVNKSALLDLLFNNTDGQERALALGQAVLSSVRTAAQDGKVDIANGRTDPFMSGKWTSDAQERVNAWRTQSFIDNQLEYDPAELAVVPAASSNQVVTGELDHDALDSLLADMDVDWELPVLSPVSLTLELKYAKLDELLMANEIWNKIIYNVQPLHGRTEHTITAQDFVNMVHNGTRYIISECGQLTAFRNLSTSDQKVLIKEKTKALCALRAVKEYDRLTDRLHIRYPGVDYVELGIAKCWGGNAYDEYKEFLTSFGKWSSDMKLLLILSAIALFNPNSPVSNKAAVEAERQVYIQLLRDYLENTYGVDGSRSAQEYLLGRVEYLQDFTQTYIPRVVFDFDPHTAEIFGLEVHGFRLA